MNEAQFWTIIEKAHAASPNDMETKWALIAKSLQLLSPKEIRSFDQLFQRCAIRLYHWDVWAAAYAILEGCGDDSFHDFRLALITYGQKALETALNSPDDLADFDLNLDCLCFEGMGEAAKTIWPKGDDTDAPLEKYPADPAGVPFNEWEVAKRLPKLAAKYGYVDADWESMKTQKEKAEKKQREAERIADLLLTFQFISPNGLIPPFKILAEAVRSEKPPVSAPPGNSWTPITIDQEIYWAAVSVLESLPPETLRQYPSIKASKLTLDTSHPVLPDIQAWAKQKYK